MNDTLDERIAYTLDGSAGQAKLYWTTQIDGGFVALLSVPEMNYVIVKRDESFEMARRSNSMTTDWSGSRWAARTPGSWRSRWSPR
jgi:hypothetical protein